MNFITMHDPLGEIEVPDNVLWGAQTQRSLNNFQIGEEQFPQCFIQSMAQIKKACAIVNYKSKKLSEEKKEMIIQVCDEIIHLKHTNQFQVSLWQSGSGTQTNMNVNEVIANRGNQFDLVRQNNAHHLHPNDDVNMSQSSNDVIPTAMHITLYLQLGNTLIPAMERMILTIEKKKKQFAGIVKVGRTHLQDAVPIFLSDELGAFEFQIEEIYHDLLKALTSLSQLPIGASAVGTGLNTPEDFAQNVCLQLNKQLAEHFVPAQNMFAAISSHDPMLVIQSITKRLACCLIKLGNDLRFLACGPRCGIGELNIPANEPGSSIMPGKVNPTQIEAMLMVCTQVLGYETSCNFAAAQGLLQLNTFKPLLFHNVYYSQRLLAQAMDSFNNNCLAGLTVNKQKNQGHLENNLMQITALAPKLGYDSAADIAKFALKKDITIAEAIKELTLLDDETINKLIDPKRMAQADKPDAKTI